MRPLFLGWFDFHETYLVWGTSRYWSPSCGGKLQRAWAWALQRTPGLGQAGSALGVGSKRGDSGGPWLWAP